MSKKTLTQNEAWGDYRKKINENFDEVYEVAEKIETLKINGVALKGDMTLQDMGILELTDAEIQKIFDEINDEIKGR